MRIATSTIPSEKELSKDMARVKKYTDAMAFDVLLKLTHLIR